MALNPPPRDLTSTQAVVDKESGQLRSRREDERTAAGSGIEHNKFIVCPALGVRGATARTDCTMRRVALQMPPNASRCGPCANSFNGAVQNCLCHH